MRNWCHGRYRCEDVRNLKSLVVDEGGGGEDGSIVEGLHSRRAADSPGGVDLVDTLGGVGGGCQGDKPGGSVSHEGKENDQSLKTEEKVSQDKKNPFGEPQAEVDFACVYNL